LFVAVLVLLTAALSRAGNTDVMFGILIAAASAAVVTTVWWHRKADDPILPVRLLRTVKFTASNAAHLAAGISLITVMVTVPLMANTVLGLSPLDGGLMLLRMTVAIPFGAIVGGLLVQRVGPRRPAIAGFALAAVGLAAMSQWDIDIEDPSMTMHLAISGFGFGLLIAPIHTAALLYANAGERGTASALITVSRMVGMTIGLAAMAAWGTLRFESLTEDAPITLEGVQEITSAGLTVFQGFFMSASVVAVLGVIPAWLMSRDRVESASGAST
jgi:hypothetical protein